MNDKEQISIKNKDNYIVITINEEEFSPELIHHNLQSIITEINTHKNIWVVGFDLTNVKKISNLDSRELIDNYSLTNLIINIKKPVVGLMNGDISNRLLELTLPMDYRIAGVNSSFRMSQMYDYNMQFDGATRLLPRIIGLNQAKQMIMFGKTYDSKAALKIGLINELVEDSNLNLTLDEKLLNLSKNSPLAMQFTKNAINFNLSTNTMQGMNSENDLYSILLNSHDRKQSINAFKNRKKRKPYSGE